MASGGGCYFQCYIAACESKDDSNVMGWNRTSSARGTPFGNKDRAAEIYSAVVSISEWLGPASLDHRLHQYGMECIRGREKGKSKSPHCACFASRDTEKLFLEAVFVRLPNSLKMNQKKRWKAAGPNRYSSDFSFQICSITRLHR